jgi:hypothetical protein
MSVVGLILPNIVLGIFIMSSFVLLCGTTIYVVKDLIKENKSFGAIGKDLSSGAVEGAFKVLSENEYAKSREFAESVSRGWISGMYSLFFRY